MASLRLGNDSGSMCLDYVSITQPLDLTFDLNYSDLMKIHTFEVKSTLF